MKIYLIYICLALTSLAVKAQDGYYIDKDARIKSRTKDIVNFLLVNKEVARQGKGTVPTSYLGEIFIKKHLEVFSNQGIILLIQFGSLSDHGNKYWALLDNTESSFIRITDEKLLGKKYNKKIIDLFLYYINNHASVN